MYCPLCENHCSLPEHEFARITHSKLIVLGLVQPPAPVAISEPVTPERPIQAVDQLPDLNAGFVTPDRPIEALQPPSLERLNRFNQAVDQDMVVRQIHFEGMAYNQQTPGLLAVRSDVHRVLRSDHVMPCGLHIKLFR